MTIEELKELILWCKANKVKHLTKEGVHFELSDLAFIENLMEEPLKEMNLDTTKVLVDDMKVNQKDEDEDLFWSSK